MNKLIILAIISVSSSCIGVKVNTAYDPTVDFKGYETFCWLQGCDNQFQGPNYVYNAERLKTIQGSIQQELESKGFVNEQNQPDLLVGFHIIVEEQQTTSVNRERLLDFYEQKVNYWDGYELYDNNEVYKFLKGTLVIDIVDAQSGNAIWQGTSRRYMESVPELDQEDIKKAIKKALKNFPPDLY
jgi:hypothetical protein